MVKYIEKEFKSVLNRHKFVDSWFWDRYSISPYQGCEHNCIYCYARSHKYNLHPESFENVIYVKKDAAYMLDLRISRARTLLPDIVGMSGNCDPYQSAEAKFKNTRRCLEILAKHKWPVNIFTKSPLVLRDLDILSQIAKNTWATVSFTITTTNNKIANFLEPNVVLPKERFKAISEIKKNAKNIQTGVVAIPIVPYLEDDEDDIKSMVKEANEAGADYFVFGPGITMEGDQAIWYMKRLSDEYPELVSRYEEIYKFKYSQEKYNGTYGPKKSYIIKIAKKVFKILEKYHMPYRIKRFIPNDFRKMNYIIAEKLLNKAYVNQDLGKPFSNLHWAGQNIQNLKESIVEVAKGGELQKIRNVNEEIELFIKENIDT